MKFLTLSLIFLLVIASVKSDPYQPANQGMEMCIYKIPFPCTGDDGNCMTYFDQVNHCYSSCKKDVSSYLTLPECFDNCTFDDRDQYPSSIKLYAQRFLNCMSSCLISYGLILLAATLALLH
ncbi:hypothetical protein ABPG72_006597 [Tetrahymena utriculariae]